MTEGFLIISDFLTNELRLILGLCFLAKLTDFSVEKKPLLFSAAGGFFVTVLQRVSGIGSMGAEVLLLAGTAWYSLRGKRNLCLFLAFSYEIGVGLWDFLLQAAFGILFRSGDFLNPAVPQHLAGIWLARLAMLGIAAAWAKQKEKSPVSMRLASSLALFGLLGAVTLSEQRILPLNEDQTGAWIILSMVLMFSVLFYRLSRQREMELEIARLKQDQAEIVERDYQALRRTYEENAKLYHDLHNHIETIYQCLVQGDTREAVRYCEDLRTPAREISQTVWTGDKALDCLISSKMTMAKQEQIKTKVNIEYPHNTNIRSVDLAAILGNLLDNGLEAAKTAPKPLRILNLTIRRIHAMLIIKVENGYGSAPIQKDGSLLTSKEDKAFHGWGLKSVQTAADRYDGIVQTDYKDGMFRAVVTLSFQPVKTE